MTGKSPDAEISEEEEQIYPGAEQSINIELRLRGPPVTKAVIICGAGSTLSDASNVTPTKRPPLDRGFFRLCRRLKLPEFSAVATYISDAYGIDVCKATEDSLERIMAILYSDLENPATSTDDAAEAFRMLLRLINRRIAETTNGIQPAQKSNLYRIVRSLILDCCITPSDISIITFNYDLHIEKTLSVLQRSSSIRKAIRPLIRFPYCYRLRQYTESTPPKSAKTFKSSSSKSLGIEVLKMHGSLNWFSVHKTSNPAPDQLIRTDHDLWITSRQKVPVDMTITLRRKKKRYTFPIVVPPVVNKAGILHNSMGDVWKRAMKCLATAEMVIVFGYSCPQADQESANLIARSFRKNEGLSNLTIIDPSTNAFTRFAELSNADAIYYYRSARYFLRTS